MDPPFNYAQGTGEISSLFRTPIFNEFLGNYQNVRYIELIIVNNNV